LFCVSVIEVVGEKLVIWYGPVPAELLANHFSACGSPLVLCAFSASGLTIGSQGITPGRNAYGAVSSTTTVSGPEAEKPFRLVSSEAGPWSISRIRFRLVTTAFASSLAPSWNTTPLRSWKV
jgi:hypothetical protein